MQVLPLCTLLSLLATPAHAGDARPAKPEMKVNVPEYQLESKIFDFPTGLRIIMQSDRSHPVVTVFSVVNNGTKDDPTGKEETAHFVEHTWFRSKHGDLPPIMDVIQDLGTRFNATTRNDWTDYRTVASSEYLPLMLRLESLRLTEPHKGVTEAEIDVEREVIRNEWRRRNEQNSSLFINYLYEAVYPADHGYHDHSTHESIDHIKLADLQKFMDDYYHPQNTTIFVVGDFEPTEAASLIFENFEPTLLHPKLTLANYFYSPKPGVESPDQNNPSHWLTGAWDPDSDPANPQQFRFTTREVPRITEQRPPVPEVGTTEVRTSKGPFEHKTVVVGWSLPGGFRSDHWDLIMVGNTASQYVGSAFGEEIDNREIGEVACFAIPEVLNTTVACYAELLDDDVDPIRTRDKMLDQLAEIWNPENFVTSTSINAQVYQTFFTRAKMEGVANLLLTLDLYAVEFGGRGEDITPHAHYTNGWAAHSDGMQKLMSMDASRISKMAYEYLKRDRAATVILEPLDDDEIDVGSESSTYRGANATDQVIRSSDDLTSITTDMIADSYIVPDLSDIVDFTMPNGLRVVILPHGVAPVVDAALIFRRDTSTEADGLFSFAQSFTRSVGHDPLPIAASPSWGVDAGIPGLSPGKGYPLLGNNNWANAFRTSIRAPSGNLDGALWLMREELETSGPVLDGKPDFIKDQRKYLKRDWADHAWHLAKARNEYLFPGADAYDTRTWADIDTMETWGAAQIDGYLAQHFQPSNGTLLIVGNVDAAKAKQQAEMYFGGWAPRKDAPPPPAKTMQSPAMPTQPNRILIYDEPNRTQTDIVTQCRLNITDASQEIAVDVLSSLLSNKTFSQLRVAEGLAYSPQAFSNVNSDGSSTLTFASLAVNSGIGRTIQFFQEAIQEVQAGKVDAQEVTLHKLRQSRADGVSLQSMGQMSDALTTVIRKGKGWDFATDRGDLISQVQPDDLKNLLQGCGEHMITTMEGPKDVIVPQLDELGLTYEVVAWRAVADELLLTHDPKAAKKKEKDRQKSDKKKAKEAEKEKDEPKEPEPTPAPTTTP